MSAPRTQSSRLYGVWNSFWFLPMAIASSAVVLAVLLLTLELTLALPVVGFLPSEPAGARSLLSSIITAMISFTALVFSITVVAVQLASSQYSPRVLRAFLQDRITQVTLGVFVATFLFAMVVLAALPDGADARLPELSLALSMALVLGSTGTFIYYLHHITAMMRVSHMIAAIGAQTRDAIGRWAADPADQDESPPLGPVVSVLTAPASGAVTSIDLERLGRIAREHDCAIAVTPTPGDFVVEGLPILTIHQTGDAPPRPVDPASAAAGVDIGVERVPGQDIGFGLRQLSDIAERALSPGINDVTTAVRALQESHDLLRRLAGRPDRARTVRDDDGGLRVQAGRQSFDSHLAVSIDDIQRTAPDQPRIVDLIATILSDLETVARPEHRATIRRRRAVVDARVT